MFDGRLQLQRTALMVRVLCLLLGGLALAAGEGRAGRTPASILPSTRKVKTQTPPPPPMPIPNPTPPGGSGKSSEETPTSGAGAEWPTATPSMSPAAAGRRDPFKPWGVPGAGSHPGAGRVSGALPAGTRGLVIPELRLVGIVHQQTADSMIAVVTNYTKRAYFLRVNDTVYDGVVSKITPEAVYFMENTLDASGRVATREVVIKLGSGLGEGR